MPIQSLIFDFDGLILDTETPEMDIWKVIYAEHGCDFPVHLWVQIIGGNGSGAFDAAGYLHQLADDSPDVNALRLRHRLESARRILEQPIRDGVQDYLTEARRWSLQLAIASSSPHSWVDTHLSRLGLAQRFDKIICADDVAPGRTKPNPDLFLKALECLEARADEAIVFEDSPNGVKAARTAGLFVVAVPNPTTALLRFEGENLRLNSLADLPLSTLLKDISSR
jgi:HAD superfamily hydrolase (TIGR01509 family)